VPRGASSAAFCFEAYTRREPLRGSRSVKIKFLGRRFRVVLIERLDQVGPAVDALSGGERDRETAMDGEFDLVARAGRSCQRMALLTMLPVGGTTLFSFHLPTLFAGLGAPDGRWRAPLDAAAPGGHAGVAQLLAFLRGSPLVTWAGASSDLPALRFALPALEEAPPAGAPAPFSRHVDLQAGVAARVRAGALPPDTPLGLGKALISHCGVSLDKSLTISPWGSLPTAEMLAYAAADVISTAVLFQKNEEGALFMATAGAAEGGAAAAAAAPPPFSAAAAVAAAWGAVLARLHEMSLRGDGAPTSAAALGNKLVSSTAALSKVASAAPRNMAPLSEAVLAKLAEQRSGLPPWVVALLLERHAHTQKHTACSS
jgi:hypothetical protein